MSNAFSKNYLAHHGIKGQQWGVRNGPPYPLGIGKRSAAEEKANNSQKRKTDDNILNKSSKDYVSNGKKFVSKQSGAAVELIAYTTVMAAMIAWPIISDKITRKKFAKELENKPVHYNKIEDIPKLSESMPASENMKKTNPNYPKEGYVQNCTFCTAAMVMREKGYDVQADYSKHGWYTGDLYKKVFNAEEHKFSKEKNHKTSDDLLNCLSKYGDGAYGELDVSWWLGGGHSIFWKNESGQVHIYDGQSGVEYETKSNGNLFSSINLQQTSYFRLDDKEPTDYILKIVK